MAGNWHRIGDIKGRDGIGVPTGGARGDVLKKEGGTDYATSWGAVDYADIQGKVPASALPEIGTAPYVVDSQAAMLNLPAVPGRQAIRTDIGATFVLAQEPASTLGNWVEMVSRSDVTSVNSKTGSVVLTKADVGLSEVNNTADSDKPVATQSVRGLMSSDDKTKLDKATYVATNGTLVERSSSGYVNFRQAVLSDQPSNSGHAVPLGFLESELGAIFGGTSFHGDIDTLTEPGVYSSNNSSSSTVGNGHPEGTSGSRWSLFVLPVGGTLRQQVLVSNSKIFSRYTTTFNPYVWSEWRSTAEDVPATPSRDGLMPSADKALLDTAANGATANSLVRRNSAGRFNAAAPTTDGQVANKGYVDSEINRLVAGATIGFDESWDTLGTLSRAGIVEGFPIGCPAGRDTALLGDDDPSDGFVKDPVWRFHHEVMGLGYHRQTAELLSCDPDYMIGFTWERTYRPGDAQWTRWNCIAGDTGDIDAMPSGVGNTRDREWVYTYHNGRLYTDGVVPYARRSGDTVYLVGAGKPIGAADLPDLASNDGIQVGYFRYADEWPIRRIWVNDSHVTGGMNPQGVGVQQGSSKNRWFLNTVNDDNQHLSIRASRYGPQAAEDLSTNTWLPYSTSWLAPQVMTWQGSGWYAG